jgi:hypothetical protein
LGGNLEFIYVVLYFYVLKADFVSGIPGYCSCRAGSKRDVNHDGA